uniref:Membrane protein, palmitoylated 4a (MAGUK p55 subfamily member 4) n=1 Tax=Pundamilia nyererei TaxID=303518 RepID=A0A3B4FB04_9CICH
VSVVLSSVVKDVDQAVSRNINGAQLLHELLSAPWLFSGYPLLIIYLSVYQALLSSHDSVAQSDYEPVLPPLPDEIPEDEEAMRIVCLVKNNQPLGATIRKDEATGDISIARVIHGGLADRSGIQANSQGTILFKIIPNPSQVCMRAMVDYCPLQDFSIPCPDAGMAFSRGDLLQVVDQSDGQWWQARKLPCATSCAGLIPSASMLKSKQREQWWCQPLQVHTCIRPREESWLLLLNMCLFNGLYIISGFRRSFRVWKRTSYRKRRQSCTTCSPNTNALSTPYEEVVLYQRPPQENHRLIILVGEMNSQLYGISTDAIDEVLKRGRMCIIDAEPHSIQLLRTKKFKPYVIFIKPPSPDRLRETRRDARIITNYAINRVFSEEDFAELEETSKPIEAKYKQFFDSVLVNDDLQDACIELCSIIQQAQDEPQWIPVSWGRAED